MLLAANWGLEAIEAPQVWSRGYTGEGVVVAVIDSGINPHPDLLPNLWQNPGERVNSLDDDNNGYVNDLNGWDFAENDNNPVTNNRHGNHVLGIIASSENGVGSTGVAYDAKVMPLRVFDEQGNSSTKYVADAIRFAVNQGADIVNLSVGGIASQDVQSAINYASLHDVLIVASAGNSGAGEPSFPASASTNFSNVISVGGHDKSFRRWASSNTVGRSGAVQVDAPGVGIYSTSTNGGYASSTGTSSAAAHVAGVAALVLSADPNLTAEELRNVLVEGASRRVTGSDSKGAINARRSIELVLANPAKSIGNPADFDGNGQVDFGDFIRLSRNFGESGKSHADGDTDRNGTVDFQDFLTFSRSFAQTIAAVPPAPAAVDAVMSRIIVTGATARSASTNTGDELSGS